MPDGEAVREALAHLDEFEVGHSGSGQVLAATHAPIEPRLKALE